MSAPPLADTRVYRNHHLDSTRWDHVPYRAGDIVVTTPYKTGTTWTQRILAALLHGPSRLIDRELTPWVDARIWGPIEPIAAGFAAQDHRRFAKSHLALDGTRWSPEVQFVVVGRDLRDIFASLVNHWSGYGDVAYAELNDEGNPGEPMPAYPGDPRQMWAEWIARGWFDWEPDGWPFWSATHHLTTWWTARDEPNVLLVHYADLLADLEGEITRLVRFLGLPHDAPAIAEVTAVSRFDRMKADMLAAETARGGPAGAFIEGGIQQFVHKGTNGRWRELLTDDDLAAYEARAATWDPAFRRWMEHGRLA